MARPQELDDGIGPERSLWCHICEHMPLPEKEEMASLIGFSLIQNNEVRACHISTPID